MGCHFAALAGTGAFVIDQNVSVEWHGQSRAWLPGLLATPPLDHRTGVDAVVVSTDNALT